MRSFFANLRQLVIPMGAQPGSPSIILGPDIPQELQTWAAANTITLVAVERYVLDATQYTWTGIGTFFNIPTKFEGTYDTTNGVYLTTRTLIGPGLVEYRFGFGPNPFNFLVEYIATTVAMFGPARLALDSQTEFTIDSISQGRGLVDFVGTTSDQVVGAEAVVLTGNPVTFRAGRAFEVKVHHILNPAAANSLEILRIRRTNLAGVEITRWVDSIATAGGFSSPTSSAVVRNNTASAINDNLVATLDSPTGNTTVIGSATPRWMSVFDVGDAARFPNAPTL